MKLLVLLEPLDIHSRHLIGSDLGFENSVFVWPGEDDLKLPCDEGLSAHGLDGLYNKVIMMSNNNPFVHFWNWTFAGAYAPAQSLRVNPCVPTCQIWQKSSSNVNCAAHRQDRTMWLMSKSRASTFLLNNFVIGQTFLDHNFKLNKNKGTNFYFLQKIAIFAWESNQYYQTVTGTSPVISDSQNQDSTRKFI